MHWRAVLFGLVTTAGLGGAATSGVSLPRATICPALKQISKAAVPALRFSVQINEFLPDPDPSAGLPPASFIEIRNVSANPVWLQGWRIGNGKTSGVIRADIVLEPDSLILFCPASAAGLYAVYGNTFALAGFPTLSHVSGEVILTGPEDEVVDAVAYDRESFNDPVKAEGGWSLERIDPARPCLGKSNWTASIDPAGGTPGRINAVNGIAASGDEEASPVQFIRSFCSDSTHILLLLNGPVDAGAAMDPLHYRLDPALAIGLAEPSPPFFDRILLTMSEPLKRQQLYEISTSDISSCGVQVSDAVLRTGMAAAADSGDLLFNEILFNPPSFGSDYIELYQCGNKIIDLQNCQLASRDNTGQLKDPRPVTTEPWQLFPRDYVVVTKDKRWVQSHYLVRSPAQLLELSALPSMPDDKGILVLLNNSGKVIDELPYNHQWQSPLIADESGVALEKTGTALPSGSASSWTSAASTAGFGTPTYANSQSDASGYDSSRSMVAVSPAVFSPDNDGYHDFCFVTIRPGTPGFTANISIYDINGVNIKSLASGASMGSEGKFRWDGADDNGNPLASGRYVIFTEIFSLKGTVRRFKHPVVLARRRKR